MFWTNFFKVIILLIGIALIGSNAALYNFYAQQKKEISSIKDNQEVESEFDNNKFKHQQDQMDRLDKALEDAQQQIKDQNDALFDQKDESRNIQTSQVDIKAEADAIKQDMKGWQKDDVSVLAGLEKKMDNFQDEIKGVKDNLDSLNISELKENINSLKGEIERNKGKDENQL